MAQISAKLLGITPEEAKEGYFIPAIGNFLPPQIDSGDYLFVKKIRSIPMYLQGVYIVSLDGESLIKDIQVSEKEIIIRNVNKDYEDIIIPTTEDSKSYFWIAAKVLAVIKNLSRRNTF